MRGALLISALVLVMLFSIPVSAQGESSEQMNFGAAVPHEPIRIDNDTDLADTAAAEGWQGDGSEGNPYVIENYIIDARGNNSAIYIGNITKRVIVRNCTVFNATDSSGYGWGSGIAIFNSPYVVVDNITSYDNQLYGVYIGRLSDYVVVKNSHFLHENTTLTSGIMVSSNYVTLENNTIEKSTWGIWISYGYYTRIYSNRMNGTGIYIISGSNSDQFDIPTNNTINGKPVMYITGFRNNQSFDVTNAGEVIMGKVSWAKIGGMDMNNSGPGVLVLGSSNVSVESTTLENATGPGIFVASSDNITVDGFYMKGTGSWGIRAEYIHNLSVRNSTIIGYPYPLTNSIYMYSSYNVLVENTTMDGSQNGIYISSYTSHHLTVLNSTFHSFSRYGVYVYNSDTSRYVKSVNVINSTFWHSGYDAVYLNMVDGGVIRGNAIISTSYSANRNGIRLATYTQNVMVERNTITGANTGIYVANANSNHIAYNSIENGYYCGLNLFIGTGNTVEFNYINSTGNYGIYINSARDNVIRSNYVGNATLYGVYIYSTSATGNLIYNNSFYFNHGSTDTYDMNCTQAYDNGNNAWNTTSGIGNYWHDWANNNDTNDNDGDGIVDWAYKIDGSAGAEDSYPLKKSPVYVPELQTPVLIILVLLIMVLLRRLD